LKCDFLLLTCRIVIGVLFLLTWHRFFFADVAT